MKKKIFGVKVGTILTGLLCLAVAFAFWFFVEYADDASRPTTEVAADVSGCEIL